MHVNASSKSGTLNMLENYNILLKFIAKWYSFAVNFAFKVNFSQISIRVQNSF